MKKLSVYYLCHIVINAILLIVFSSNIDFHVLSVLPLFLIALMIFQATQFKRDKNEADFGDTAYSVGDTARLTDAEQDLLYSYLQRALLIALPFELPLIFFFSSYLKLFGLLPYFLAYILGGIVFKVKKGKYIQNRIRKEKKELEEQRQKEELGQV